MHFSELFKLTLTRRAILATHIPHFIMNQMNTKNTFLSRCQKQLSTLLIMECAPSSFLMEAVSVCAEQIVLHRKLGRESPSNFQNKTPFAERDLLDHIHVTTCGTRPEVRRSEAGQGIFYQHNKSSKLHHTAISSTLHS